MVGKRRSFAIERSVTVRSPAERVMGHLLDAGEWPAWQPEIISTQGPERIESGDVVSGRAQMLGFDVDGRSVAVEVSDGVFEEDVVVGVAMRVRYEVTPAPNGCVVTHRLESLLPGGVAGRLVAFLLRGRLRKMQRTAVERLAAQSEASES